jgi:hypothetical protein
MLMHPDSLGVVVAAGFPLVGAAWATETIETCSASVA